MKNILPVLIYILGISACTTDTRFSPAPAKPSVAPLSIHNIEKSNIIIEKSEQVTISADQISCEDIKNQQYQQAILKAINDIRHQSQQCGATLYSATTSLAWHPLLQQSSSTYADLSAQRRVISHYGTEGQSLRERIKLTGYKGGGGENLASGQQTLGEVLGHWLSLSPGHCDNLMQAKYRHYAIACTRSETTQRPYWVQHFGSGKDDHLK